MTSFLFGAGLGIFAGFFLAFWHLRNQVIVDRWWLDNAEGWEGLRQRLIDDAKGMWSWRQGCPVAWGDHHACKRRGRHTVHVCRCGGRQRPASEGLNAPTE